MGNVGRACVAEPLVWQAHARKINTWEGGLPVTAASRAWMAEAASQVFRPNHPHATSALHRELALLEHTVVTSCCAILAAHSGAQMLLPPTHRMQRQAPLGPMRQSQCSWCAYAQAASDCVVRLRHTDMTYIPGGS